jgi:DNA-binding transcriptional ArsR family regulator
LTPLALAVYSHFVRTNAKAFAATSFLANAAAYRIVATLATRGSQTTEQIGSALPDIPPSTLYRHLAQLRDAGLIRVVEERQARGAVERTYAIASAEAGNLSLDELQSAPLREVKGAVRNFLAGLTAHVVGLIESRAYARDRSLLRSGLVTIHLSDDEYDKASRAIIDVLREAKARSRGPSVKRRYFYLIALPEAPS